MNQDVSYLTLPDRKLAYQQRRATLENFGRPGVIFLGGFASDMTGTKALFLDERCVAAGLAFLRFDYRGHGQSSASFAEGCIGDWADDALQLLDRLTTGPQILVGSSMGGWMGLLLSKARPDRVAGFVGIAAAPDFTEDLILPALSPQQREELALTGQTYDPDAPPDHKVPVTQKLLDEGRRHLLLRQPWSLGAPVRLIQGQCDTSVPWKYALKIAQTLEDKDVQIRLVKDGDHRLSRPQDLALLWQEVETLAFGDGR